VELLIRQSYYAAVSYIDDLVGQLLAQIDDLGLRDNTVVVLTSDHGNILRLAIPNEDILKIKIGFLFTQNYTINTDE